MTQTVKKIKQEAKQVHQKIMNGRKPCALCSDWATLFGSVTSLLLEIERLVPFVPWRRCFAT